MRYWIGWIVKHRAAVPIVDDKRYNKQLNGDLGGPARDWGGTGEWLGEGEWRRKREKKDRRCKYVVFFPSTPLPKEGMAAHVYTSFVYRCWKMCQVAPTSPPSLLTLPSPLLAHHPTYFFLNFLKKAIIFCKKYVLFFYRFLFTVDSPFSGRRGGIASCIPYFVCVLFRLTSSSCHWILWY